MSRLKILGSWMERLTTEVYDRLINLWKKGMEPEEIAEVLEANEATTRTAINRMSKKGYLVKVGESWGLKQ